MLDAPLRCLTLEGVRVPLFRNGHENKSVSRWFLGILQTHFRGHWIHVGYVAAARIGAPHAALFAAFARPLAIAFDLSGLAGCATLTKSVCLYVSIAEETEYHAMRVYWSRFRRTARDEPRWALVASLLKACRFWVCDDMEMSVEPDTGKVV